MAGEEKVWVDVSATVEIAVAADATDGDIYRAVCDRLQDGRGVTIDSLEPNRRVKL